MGPARCAALRSASHSLFLLRVFWHNCNQMIRLVSIHSTLKFEEFVGNTAISSMTSGIVGAFVGGSMYYGASQLGTAGKEVNKSLATTITQDSTSSSTRKLFGTKVKEVIGAI